MADPNHPDNRFVKDTYDLNAITHGNRTDVAARVDGDWVVWGTREYPGIIMAYNFATKKLESLGVGPYSKANAHISHGRVIFNEGFLDNATTGIGHSSMVLWDSSTGLSRILETGLGGTADCFDFDGTWALFSNRLSNQPKDNGLWAINVNTGERGFLFPANRTNPDGSTDQLRGQPATFRIDSGKAYFFVFHQTPEDQENYYNSTLYESDFAGKNQRSLPVPEAPIIAFQKEGNSIGYEAQGEVWLYDLTTGKTRELDRGSIDPDGINHTGANHLVLRGDWALWSDKSSKNYGVPAVRGYNMKTGDAFELAPLSSEMGFDYPDTDGYRLVLSAYRLNTYFKTVGPDLYWTDFPPHGPTTTWAQWGPV